MNIRRIVAASVAAARIIVGIGADEAPEVSKVFPVKPGECDLFVCERSDTTRHQAELVVPGVVRRLGVARRLRREPSVDHTAALRRNDQQ